MKKIEWVFGLLSVVGIVLKIFRIPGAGALTVLALSTLSMFYCLFSFALFNNIKLKDVFSKTAYANTNAKRILGAIALGFTISTITMGLLFKVMIWPGAITQLLAGIVSTGLISGIALFIYMNRPSDNLKSIFKRVRIYLPIAMILYVIPTNTIVDVYYRNNPEYAELYKKVLADPKNVALREQLFEMEKEEALKGLDREID